MTSRRNEIEMDQTSKRVVHSWKKREFQTQWSKDEGQLVILIGARL